MPRRWSIPLIKWCGHSCFWGGVFPGSCDGVGPGSLHMAGQRRGRHVQMISAIDSVLLRAVYYCWTSLPSNGLSIDAPLSARLSFEGSDPLSTASSRVQIGHWVFKLQVAECAKVLLPCEEPMPRASCEPLSTLMAYISIKDHLSSICCSVYLGMRIAHEGTTVYVDIFAILVLTMDWHAQTVLSNQTDDPVRIRPDRQPRDSEICRIMMRYSNARSKSAVVSPTIHSHHHKEQLLFIMRRQDKKVPFAIIGTSRKPRTNNQFI